MRRAFSSLALVVVSIGFALGVGELLVRLLLREQTVMFPRYHTEYRYGDYALRGIRPNAEFWHTSVDGSWRFVTNSRGLRDAREFAYEKPPGTLRVLALGDSHTQGYEVRQEATFSAVLERYLNTHLHARGGKAEVLNAGVSGFSTAEAAAYLEAEGHRYQPDVVVLGFYANDFEDNLKAALFTLNDGKLLARKRSHLPGVSIQNLIYSIPGVGWLGENSYFYSVLFNTVWTHFKALSLAHAKDEAFDFAVPTKEGHSDYEVELAVAIIERMRRFCEANATRFIVVDIPRRIAPYRFSESMKVADAGFEYVSSRTLLSAFEGAAEVHVPHGHKHISEFTHAIIGVELGRRILEKK
jgi:hypothetical protein